MHGQWREPAPDAGGGAANGGRRRLLGAAALTGAALAAGLGAGGATARAQDGGSIVGAWLVSVPQPNGSTYEAATAFTADGIMLTLFSPGDTRANEGPSFGAGAWAPAGERAITFSFVAPLYDAQGRGAGQARVQGILALGESDAEASGPARITFLASDGGVRERSPLIPVTARRITLEPLEP